MHGVNLVTMTSIEQQYIHQLDSHTRSSAETELVAAD